MADKMSTIVMMVDLECDRCYKKIRRVLCKLQDKASIKAISYDEKKNTVTVAGPFDADELSDRLCSSAGKVITDIRVLTAKSNPPAAAAAAAKAHANHKPPGKDGGGGGGGGKPEMMKKHVNFDMDDDDDHHHHHGGGGGGKPKVVNSANSAAATALARMEGHRAGGQPPMQMAAAMAPVPMPMTMHQPAAMSTPSIWPAPPPAPEWGHVVPAYGAGWAPPPAAGGGGYGYYGGVPMYGGQPPAYGGGGRSSYYEEEPAAGCRVM